MLHHEVAHVLISRAARGAPIPLWFHEGLAVQAERTWRFEDDARLLRELVLVSPISLDSLDALFAADGASRARAYTLAAAFWNGHRFWTSIAPFLTTQTALWMIVTIVGIYAIIRRRQQRAAQRAGRSRETSRATGVLY